MNRVLTHNNNVSEKCQPYPSGAHTIGRAFKERSGVTEKGYGDKKGTPYTTGCPVMKGGGGGGGGGCPFMAGLALLTLLFCSQNTT
jgi:hypothetical protein